MHKNIKYILITNYEFTDLYLSYVEWNMKWNMMIRGKSIIILCDHDDGIFLNEMIRKLKLQDKLNIFIKLDDFIKYFLRLSWYLRSWKFT